MEPRMRDVAKSGEEVAKDNHTRVYWLHVLVVEVSSIMISADSSTPTSEETKF